ncbi:MAG: hypothetical protein K2I36_02715 [Ureaplasma sp.]|nr:hypothetical protein [Ureaplasma sp.]MDE7221665.1 hypothetical protein [Ureaplasma sp.]
MSYYQKNKFSITKHALVRAKQRLPDAKDKSDLILEFHLLNLLQQIGRPEFMDNHYDYYHLYQYDKKYLYVVVNRSSNLIITVTKISIEKQLNICYKKNK